MSLKDQWKSFAFGFNNPSNAACAEGAWQGAYEGPWGGVPKNYDRRAEAQKAAAENGAPENFHPGASFYGALTAVFTGVAAVRWLVRTEFGKDELSSFAFGLRHPHDAMSAAGAFDGAKRPWGCPKNYDGEAEAQKAAEKFGAPGNFKPGFAAGGSLTSCMTGSALIMRALKL